MSRVRRVAKAKASASGPVRAAQLRNWRYARAYCSIDPEMSHSRTRRRGTTRRRRRARRAGRPRCAGWRGACAACRPLRAARAPGAGCAAAASPAAGAHEALQLGQLVRRRARRTAWWPGAPRRWPSPAASRSPRRRRAPRRPAAAPAMTCPPPRPCRAWSGGRPVAGRPAGPAPPRLVEVERIVPRPVAEDRPEDRVEGRDVGGVRDEHRPGRPVEAPARDRPHQGQARAKSAARAGVTGRPASRRRRLRAPRAAAGRAGPSPRRRLRRSSATAAHQFLEPGGPDDVLILAVLEHRAERQLDGAASSARPRADRAPRASRWPRRSRAASARRCRACARRRSRPAPPAPATRPGRAGGRSPPRAAGSG